MLYSSLLFFVTVIAQYPEIDNKVDRKVRAAIEAKIVYDFIQQNVDSVGYLNKRAVNYDEYVLMGNCEFLLNYKAIDSIDSPIDGYKLFEVRRELDKIRCNGKNRVTIKSHEKSNVSFESYLIGVNPKTNQVIYISGNFFKSRISRYYDLTNDDELLEYLKLKMFEYDVKELKRIDNCQYELKCKKISKRIIITIDKNDPDIIQAKHLEK